MFVPNVPFRWEHRQPTETNTYCSGPRAHGSLRRRRNELHIASMEGLSMQRATPCPAPRDGGGKRVARLWVGETLMAQCSTPLRTSRAQPSNPPSSTSQPEHSDIASAAKQSPGSVRQPKHSDIASAAKQSPGSLRLPPRQSVDSRLRGNDTRGITAPPSRRGRSIEDRVVSQGLVTQHSFLVRIKSANSRAEGW